MKLIFIVLSVSSFNFCDNVLIMRLHKLGMHFAKRTELGLKHNDPLGKFTLRSRQLLCDAVMVARQFLRSPTGRAASRSTSIQHTELLKWESIQYFRRTNYQRSISPSLKPEPVYFKYRPKKLKFYKFKKDIKMIHCINNPDIQWYVTFGVVDKFMYLIEHMQSAYRQDLHVTAIIEPNAVLAPLGTYEYLLQYIWAQLKNGQESKPVLCYLGVNEHIRLCSSAFHVLNDYGILYSGDFKEDNYVTVFSKCVDKVLRRNQNEVSLRVRPCSVNRDNDDDDDDDDDEPEFFLHGDAEERSSVFVYTTERGSETLSLITRISRIGVLINT